ncbi:MAG: hypothetical protein ABI680_14150 [Chthoniobacteraceae bacterium]
MTNYHYKVGEGFTIRYGGPEGIRWFNAPASGPGNPQMPTVGLGAAEPIGMAIEAAKAAGLLLQWWEMRKQTLLQTAQFEERRIPWLTDMLLQWASEIEEGQVRLDTVTYFDREVSRFLDAIGENNQVDVPSTLLLQLERSARAMVRINSVLSSLLLKQDMRPNFILEGQPQPFAYQPFLQLLDDHAGMERYLSTCDGATQAVLDLSPSLFAQLGNIYVKTLLLGPLGMLGAAAFWKFKEMGAAEAKAKQQKRMQEFRAMLGLALELRSSRTLLTIAAPRPETLKKIELPDSVLLDVGSKRRARKPRMSSAD